MARFARHLSRHLDDHPETAARVALPLDALPALHALCTAPSAGAGPGAGVDAGAGAGPGAGPGADARPPTDTSRDATAPDIAAQDALLARLRAHLDGHVRATVAIEAPRGHGKSALLGRLAAQLERDGVRHAVCAARRAAVDVLERHRRRALEACGASARTLPFVAPDAALDGAAGVDVLIVDEAASLPLPTLAALLARHRHVVLATTTEGHESAGRAFALRLPTLLEPDRPGCLHLAPPRPLRWRAGDPLDALVRRALLTRPTLAADPGLPPGCPTPPAARVERDALRDDEPRLLALSGLLAATHYQSTPLDLAHLLDAPSLALWSIERGAVVLGVALVALEPGLPDALHAAVLARRRRPPHCLLPSLLAQSADDGTALGAPCARVTRIAVHPRVRRRGLGSRLIAAIVRDTADEVEALGASFGEDAAALAFWSDNGFTPFHLGFRRNPRSGRRSMAVLRAGSARTARVLEEAASIHRDNRRVATPAEPPAGAARDARLLARFARGERSLSDTHAALRRLGGVHPDADADELSGLLAAFGVEPSSSRRAAERALRAAVANARR